MARFDVTIAVLPASSVRAWLYQNVPSDDATAGAVKARL